MNKHPFYEGHQLPLQSMHDDEFNSFIIACSDNYFSDSIPDTSFPDTHDNGFDFRRRISGSDNQYICIQSKKISNLLDYKSIAKEICKVALAAKYHDLVVKSYYLFSIKGANRKWCSDNEIKRKEELSKCAKNHLENNKLFIDIRKSLLSIGVNENGLHNIVQKFIEALESLVIYKQDDIERMIKKGDRNHFDSIIANFFTVYERKIEVNPRPDFNEGQYLEQAMISISGIIKHTIELDLYKDIKNDLIHSTPMYDQYAVSESVVISYHEFLDNLHTGNVSVITAKGGYGKTISTAHIFNQAVVQRRNSPQRPIPILIECKSYLGNVCELINRKLSLTHGEFYQIEASFILILDAIDELPQDEINRFFTDLATLIDCCSISIVITQRNNTLNREFNIGKIIYSYGIMQLTIKQMSEICKKNEMDYEESKEMIFKYIETYKDTEIQFSPFVFVKTIEYYKAKRTLPENALLLLEFYVSTRFQRNKSRVGSISNFFSIDDITDAFVSISKHMLLSGVSSVQLTEVRQICQKLSSDLSRELFMTFLNNFEIMNIVDGICSFQHQILSYYFGSYQLTTDQLISLYDDGKEKDMLIILSLLRYPINEVIRVIQHIQRVDLILASKCAISVGNDAVQALLPDINEKYNSIRLFDIWEATTAYGILRIPESCNQLFRDLSNDNTELFKNNNIKRALLLMGDESLSSEILNESEKNYAMPFNVKITPNPWNYIPISIRYRLAHERINNAKLNDFKGFNEFTNGFCFSMRFIYYTVPSDDLVLFCKKVLDTTARLNSWKTFFNAFFMVLKDNNQSDIPYLKDLLKKNVRIEERLDILIESYKLGYVLFDDDYVLNVIDIYNQLSSEEQLPSSSGNIQDEGQIYSESRKYRNLDTINKIESFLDLIDLREEHLATIFSHFYNNQVLQKRRFIWELLGKYRFMGMSLLIPTIIQSNCIESCALATLYLKNSEDAELFSDKYIHLLSEEQDKFYSYDIHLILKHLERNGGVDDILAFITPRLYAGFHLGEKKTEYDDLQDQNTPIFTRAVGLLTYLEMYLRNCPKADKSILKAFIKDNELLDFVDARNMVGIVLEKIGHKELILAIKNEEIAMEPHLIKEIIQTYEVNEIITRIGKKVFKNHSLTVWEEVLELIWHDSTIKYALDRLVYESSLPLENSEILQLQDLNRLVTKQQAISIIRPFINNNKGINEISRRTLELWYDVGIRRNR